MHNVQIDKLVLQNFRCFESLEINFDEQLTVLVAENGGGKSAILDAIAIMLRALLANVIQLRRPTLQSLDFRTELVPTGFASTREPFVFEPMLVQIRALLEKEELEWECGRLDQAARIKISKSSLVSTYTEFLKRETAKEDDHQTLPVFCYYGIGRLENSVNSQSETSHPFLRERRNGYTHCLSANSKLRPFSHWFIQASKVVYASRFVGKVPDDLYRDVGYLEGAVRNVKNAINHVLSPYGRCWFTSHFNSEEIVLDDLDRMRSLRPDQLSHGVRVMLATVGDIALRASILNPHLDAKAALETPGIVLIDEVDMHLHPSWQQLVLALLREAFPRIQFIVSTHSPQVLTTINRSQIRVIRHDNDTGWHAEMPTVSPLGQESGDALATVMDVNAKPPLDIVGTAHEYELLIRGGTGESKQARRLRRKLDEAGYQIPEAQLSLWRFLADQSGAKENG